MRWFLSPVLALLLVSCGKTENPLLCTDDCDGGQGGGTATGGGSGLGGNGGGGIGGSGAGGGANMDGGCTSNWQCSPWDLTDAGTAARVCTDIASCPGATSPGIGPVALPALDLNYYRCQVQPIVERGCGMLGCHGTESERSYRLYARGRLRNDELVPAAPSCLVTGMRNLKVDGTGTVMCLGWSRLTMTEWKKNFDRARLMSVETTVDANPLLTQPLEGSGFAHAGVKLFPDTADPSYQTLKSWLGGATSSSCDAGYN